MGLYYGIVCDQLLLICFECKPMSHVMKCVTEGYLRHPVSGGIQKEVEHLSGSHDDRCLPDQAKLCTNTHTQQLMKSKHLGDQRVSANKALK